MSDAVLGAFSANYREARGKFLEAVATASSDGEDLAMDFAASAPELPRQLIISSACHGIEGYCGSGVQVFAARDAELLARAADAGVGLIFIHALNPHGFSFGRRVTQENVDLNRNFHAGAASLPRNERYAELHALLLPQVWPPNAENQAAVGAWIAQHGERAFQAAVSQGQYEFADGLFFGGTQPTWSNTTLRALLRETCAGKTRVGWIDLHTGLGPNGHGERIFAGPDDAATVARARAWWDGGGQTPITSIYDGSSTSAFLTGLMWLSIYDEAPGTEVTGIALEYGTQDVMHVLHALRADHWLARARQRGEAVAPELAETIHAQVRAAFYTETDLWKGQIIAQARQAMTQAIHGLSQ
jgi:Protein of unknown function (DUF2817)